MSTSAEPTNEPVEPVYESIQAYIDMRDGLAAEDDVVLEPRAEPDAVPPPAAPAPVAAPASAAAPAAIPGAAPAAPPVGPPPTAPAVPPEVSEAARTLSQQGFQTRAQKRQAQIQTQIDQLTALKHQTTTELEETRRQVDALRAERAQLEQDIRASRGAQPAAPTSPHTPAPSAASPTPTTQPSAPAEDPAPVAPNPDDVDGVKIKDWDEFARLQAKWVTDHSAWAERRATAAAKKAAEDALAAERQRTEQERIAADYNSRLAAARQRYPDFDAKGLGDYLIHQAIADQIVTDPHGLDVAYYLGSNPDEARRIVALPLPQQLVEYGAIRARVVSAAPAAAPAGPVVSTNPGPTAPAIPRSQTPPPITPVGATPTASQVPLEQRSLSDYIQTTNADEDKYRRR